MKKWHFIVLVIAIFFLFWRETAMGLYYIYERFEMWRGTDYAEGYSHKKWNAIFIGMTRDEVIRTIGRPLEKDIWWTSPPGVETQCWTYPSRGSWCGYFNCLGIKDGRVTEKRSWEDD
jgi:hypothetical protein